MIRNVLLSAARDGAFAPRVDVVTNSDHCCIGANAVDGFACSASRNPG